MKQNLADWLQEESIKGNCLLICGSDDCLALTQNLISICQQKLVGFNYRHSFTADRYFNLNEINDIIVSNSLFGDKNFIELSFKTKPNIEQARQLLAILPILDENNFLCISLEKLDKKDLAQEWFATLQSQASYININGDYAEGFAWAQYIFTKNGFSIDPEALETILNLNQNNFAQLYQEINKLCLLFGSPYHITLHDIKNNLLDNAQYNVFALSTAYLSGNLPMVKKIFANVCQSIDEAILVIWNLGEDLRKLIQIKGRVRQNSNFRSAIDGLRIWGEGINHFQAAHQRISYTQLLVYFDRLAQVDLTIKGVKSGDPLVLLENLIINICLGR